MFLLHYVYITKRQINLLDLFTECSAGYYGENCNQTCGHCLVNTTCDPNNGTCSTGCSEGYKEGLCNGELDSEVKNPTERK